MKKSKPKKDTFKCDKCKKTDTVLISEGNSEEWYCKTCAENMIKNLKPIPPEWDLPVEA